MKESDIKKVVDFWNVDTMEEAKYDRVSTRKDVHATISAFDNAVVKDLINNCILRNKPTLTRDDKVLDFGCGVGRVLRGFSKMSASMYGTDISPNMLKFCREELGDAPVVLSMCSPGKIPFDDNFFDIVYSFHVLQHLATRKLLVRTIAEIHRVLASDGLFVLHFIRKVSEVDKEPGGFAGFRPTKETASNMLEAAGLSIIEIDIVEGGAFIIHGKKL